MITMNYYYKVGIVILNYNTYQDTMRLVGELQEQSISKRLHIVIVDNASPNGSYDKLKLLEEKYNNVVVLQTGENLGYARGNNFGLHYIESYIKPCNVVILNNDVHLPENCFETLCQRYQELESPGLIAPTMVDEHGDKINLSYKLNTFSEDCLYTFFAYRYIANNIKKRKKPNVGIRDMIVDIVPGSFIFGSMDVWKMIGYFYPGTFLYSEERFIAFKIKKAGLKNYILQDQIYIHAHNSPTISSVYDDIAKYKMMYVGWVEYVRVCRNSNNINVFILKLLTVYSLCEIFMLNQFKRILR